MNKPILHFLLFLSFISSSAAIHAQEDSLRRELRKATVDTNKILLYSQLAVLPSQDVKVAMSYLDSALEICQRVNDKKFTGRIIKNKGEVFSVHAQMDSAAFYFEQVIPIYTLTGNWQDLGMTYYSLGNAYNTLEKTDLSQKAFMDGASISQKHKALRSQTYCTNGLATIHFKLKNYPEAKRIHLQALEVALELDEPKLIAWVYTGLGNTMIETHKYDTALIYFSNALDNYSRANYLPGIAGAHNNIGVVYSFTDELDKAIYHYRIAAEIKHKYGELNGEATALSNISQLFVLNKQADSAVFYATAAMRIAQNLTSLQHKRMAYGYAADAYALANNFDSAYKYEVLFREYSDSVNDASLSEQISEMQAKYDNEQQQQQITLLEKNNEIGQLWNYFFAAAGGLVLVAAIFVFAGYRSKKKANILLADQNNQITEQKKEITDSIQYAKRIQQALLASDSLLSRHLKNHFVLYRPKDIVSGDFYWASAAQDSFWIAVCDSTGHGVPGAFMSLLNTTFLAEAVNERKLSQPGEVFDFARRKLLENLSHDHIDSATNDGMDGMLLKISGSHISYAGANGSAIHIHNGIVNELRSDKMPVGRSPKEAESFTTHQLTVEQGDVIYLFTDGYADQFGGERGKKFKHRALVELLQLNHKKSAQEQKSHLEASHLQWKSGLEQVDDILIVGLFF